MTPGVRVHVVMPPGLIERIDSARGEGQSRGDWVRRAVERALGPGAGLDRVDRGYAEAVKGANVAPVSPAPAEQPEMTIDEALTAYGVTPADDSTLTRNRSPQVSPSGPASPRVPFRRDVKPFQRGES